MCQGSKKALSFEKAEQGWCVILSHLKAAHGAVSAQCYSQV